MVYMLVRDRDFLRLIFSLKSMAALGLLQVWRKLMILRTSRLAAASTATMDYNLQWPANGTIDVGGSFTLTQGYEDGVTNIGNNPGTGVECWIGYSTTDASTTADFDGAGWTWVPASFSSQQGNNNEFYVDFGSAISTAGTYYYISRWSLDNGPYTYGGLQNAWDGIRCHLVF